MKFPRQIAPFVVLQRHDLAQQAAVVPAQPLQGLGQFVGFLGAPADLGRPGRRDEVPVVSLPQPGEPLAEVAQRPEGGARRDVGDHPGQQRQGDRGDQDGQKSDPLLEDVGRHVGSEHDLSDPAAVDQDGKCSAQFRQRQQIDEPAGRPARPGGRRNARQRRSARLRAAELNGRPRFRAIRRRRPAFAADCPRIAGWR